MTCWMFRYRPAIALEQVLKALGFTSTSPARAMKDWEEFSGHMGLAYVDANKDKLDCKTSMAALPLQPKPLA